MVKKKRYLLKKRTKICRGNKPVSLGGTARREIREKGKRL